MSLSKLTGALDGGGSSAPGSGAAMATKANQCSRHDRHGRLGRRFELAVTDLIGLLIWGGVPD